MLSRLFQSSTLFGIKEREYVLICPTANISQNMDRISQSSAPNLFKRHRKARIQGMVSSAPNLIEQAYTPYFTTMRKIAHYISWWKEWSIAHNSIKQMKMTGGSRCPDRSAILQQRQHKWPKAPRSDSGAIENSISFSQYSELTGRRGDNITDMLFKSNLTVKSDTQDSNVSTVVQRTTGKRDIRMWRHFRSGPADNHSYPFQYQPLMKGSTLLTTAIN